MNVLGIDPGQSGGLILMNPSGDILGKEVMPITETKELDKQAFISLLSEWDTWGRFHVFMERIVPFAMTAKSAMTFGRQLGMIEQILWDKGYSVTFVEPKKWNKEMHQGIDQNIKPKVRTSIAISRLFPKVNLLATEKSKKSHEGLCDALLIAEYGRRSLK